MHIRRMESVIVACLLGLVLIAAPTLADWADTEGMYAECFYADTSGLLVPMDSCTVYARYLSTSHDYIDVTGDEWPTLPRNVARFSDSPPPGTGVPYGWFKLWARKAIGDNVWQSDWSDSVYYYNGAHTDDTLVLYFSGAGQK